MGCRNVTWVSMERLEKLAHKNAANIVRDSRGWVLRLPGQIYRARAARISRTSAGVQA